MATVKILQDKVNKLEKKAQQKANKASRKNKKNRSRRLRKKNQRGNARSSIAISDSMSKYVNTIINPFDSAVVGRPPDAYVGESIILRDYNQMARYGIMASNATSSAGIIGVVYFLVPGYSDLFNYYSQNYGSSTNQDTPFWHIGAMAIGDQGYVVPTDDTHACYNYFAPANEEQIFQNGDIPASFAETARIIAAGFRIWPSIEVITSDTIPAIQSIYAGQMTLVNLAGEIVSQSKIVLDVLNSAGNFKTYSNSLGVSVRLNPLATNIMRMKAQDDFLQESNTLNQVQVPVVVVYYTQAITTEQTGPIEGSLLYTVPNFMQSQFWIEANLKLPTPVMQTKSPIDAGFEGIRAAILAGGDNVFPTITEGHSFRGLGAHLLKFSNHVANFFGRASSLTSKVSRGISALNSVFQDD